MGDSVGCVPVDLLRLLLGDCDIDGSANKVSTANARVG